MGPSMTIRLTDSELDAVMAAARPIAVERRDAFLQDVAAELAALPMLGAGAVHRAIAMVQGGISTRRISQWVGKAAARSIADSAPLPRQECPLCGRQLGAIITARE